MGKMEIQIQSDRINRHQEIAHELLNKKFAYKCMFSRRIKYTKRIDKIKE